MDCPITPFVPKEKGQPDKEKNEHLARNLVEILDEVDHKKAVGSASFDQGDFSEVNQLVKAIFDLGKVVGVRLPTFTGNDDKLAHCIWNVTEISKRLKEETERLQPGHTSV